MMVHIGDYLVSTGPTYIQTVRNRRLGSRFRCVCHDVVIDTGNFEPLGQKEPREQRFCLVRGSKHSNMMKIILYLLC